MNFSHTTIYVKNMEEIKKGVNLQTGIIQPNEKTRFVFVLDPNGLSVQFIEISK